MRTQKYGFIILAYKDGKYLITFNQFYENALEIAEDLLKDGAERVFIMEGAEVRLE